MLVDAGRILILKCRCIKVISIDTKMWRSQSYHCGYSWGCHIRPTSCLNQVPGPGSPNDSTSKISAIWIEISVVANRNLDPDRWYLIAQIVHLTRSWPLFTDVILYTLLLSCSCYYYCYYQSDIIKHKKQPEISFKMISYSFTVA